MSYYFKATLIKYRRRHQLCLFAGHRTVGEGRLAVCRDIMTTAILNQRCLNAKQTSAW
jgi:hypothetical protein